MTRPLGNPRSVRGRRASAMTRRRFVTQVAAAGAAVASGGSALAQPSNRVRGFDHVAVPMQNTDAMLAFYRGLGFDVRESAVGVFGLHRQPDDQFPPSRPLAGRDVLAARARGEAALR